MNTSTEPHSQLVTQLTHQIAASFPSFGGGKGSEWNPIAEMLKDKPAQFAAGVDIESVVRFTLERVGYTTLPTTFRAIYATLEEASHEAQRLNAAAGETVFNPAVYQLIDETGHAICAAIDGMEGRT